MKYSTQVKKTLSKAINHVSNNVGKFTNKPDAFIRKRKWTPEKIIRIMFSMDNHDLHSSIFSALSSQEKKEPFSVSGFIQQRDKLTLNMFSFIFRTVLKSMTSYIKDNTFRGYHLLVTAQIFPYRQIAFRQHQMPNLNGKFSIGFYMKTHCMTC